MDPLRVCVTLDFPLYFLSLPILEMDGKKNHPKPNAILIKSQNLPPPQLLASRTRQALARSCSWIRSRKKAALKTLGGKEWVMGEPPLNLAWKSSNPGDGLPPRKGHGGSRSWHGGRGTGNAGGEMGVVLSVLGWAGFPCETVFFRWWCWSCWTDFDTKGVNCEAQDERGRKKMWEYITCLDAV